MRIVVNDHGVLTLPAYAILDNMLNVPERDYRTFEEMCSFLLCERLPLPSHIEIDFVLMKCLLFYLYLNPLTRDNHIRKAHRL